MAEETKTIVSSPKDYWISPNALSISLNALGEHDRIQASVASGAVIFCYIKDIAAFDFDAGHNFRKWPLVISPTYFNSTTEKYLYVAIPRSNTIGSEAMIAFPSQLLDIYGRSAVKRIVRDEQGNMLDPDGNITTDESKADYYYIAGDQVGSEDYYYIWLHGIITASGDNSANEREWAFDPKYDTGRLNTDETWGEVVTLEDLMIALQAKVNTDWFSRLFILHGYKMSVVYKTDPETGEPLIDEETGEPIVDIDEETGLPKTVKEDVVIQPNAWPQDGDGITITDIESKYGLWTNFFLSALGKNDAGGGGGGASMLFDLLDVQIPENPTQENDGQALVFDFALGKWTNKTVGGGGGASLNEPLLSINNSGLGLPPQGLTGKVGIVWNYTTQQYEWGEAGGGGGGEGSVTSIGLTAPTGFTVTGSPITSSGTLGLAFADGYSLPTTAKQGQWDEAYNLRHSHSNKGVLDGITAEKVSAWDGVAAIMASPDSDTIINKWQEVVDFLDTYTEADTLAGLLSNKLDVSVANSDFLKKTDAANTYVTKTYFESLFELWNDNTNPSSKIAVNTDISSFTAAQKAKLNIKAMFGFWTEQYISALGKNDDGGGDVVLNEPLESINNSGLAAHPSSSGQTIVWNGSTWTYGTAGGGNITAGTGLTGGTATGTISISSEYLTKINHGESAYNMVSNMYTKNEADTKFVSITFFNKLFQAYKSTTISDANKVLPNDVQTTINNLKIMVGTWTEQYMSALGLNDSGSSGGAQVLDDLLDVTISNPTQGQVLKYRIVNGVGGWYNAADESGVGTVTQVKLGNVAYNPTNGVVSLPAYPTTLPASDVPSWAKQNQKPNYTLDEVTDGSTRKLSNYLPLAGGTMTGQIVAEMGNRWVRARDYAVIRSIKTSGDSYCPVFSAKTTSGDWSIGVKTNDERLIASYATDANYGSDSNVTTKIYFPTSDGTLALLTDNVASATKLSDDTAYSAWGQIFFTGGKPKTISSDSKLYLHKPNANNDTGAVYLVYDDNNGGIHLVGGGLYADTYVSALGLSDSGSNVFDETAMWQALGTNISDKNIALRYIQYAADGRYALKTDIPQLRTLTFKDGNGNTVATYNGSADVSVTLLTTHNHDDRYVTMLGVSGDYLTWTKNGSVNNLTVPYATHATRLAQSDLANGASVGGFVHSSDLIYVAKGGGNGCTDVPSNVNSFGLISFKTASGYYGQMLLSSGGTLYVRSSSSLEGVAWKKILDSSNWTSTINLASLGAASDARVSTLEGYFTNGVANNADKLDNLDSVSFPILSITGSTALASGDNLNDYTDFGTWYAQNATIAGSLLNTPHTVSNFKLVNMECGQTSYGLQWVFAYNSGMIYVRGRKSSTWYDWHTIAFTDSTVEKANRLTSNDKHYAWGGKYWENGVPVDVSGDMTGVGNISFSASGKNIGGLMSFVTTGNGTVGIGTLNPNTTYKLDVDGYTKTSRLYLSDDVYFVKDSNGVKLVGAGFYTDYFISALGLSDSGGDAFDVDAMWQALGTGGNEQIHKDHLTTALNGYALTSQIPTSLKNPYKLTITVNGTSTEYDGSTARSVSINTTEGAVTQIKLGTVAYNPTSGVVTLPAYPTTLPASDVSAWAKAATKPTYAFSEITGKATAAQVPNIENLTNFSTRVYDATATRTKNTVLAAPNGSNGAAVFRALVAADIPSLSGTYVTLTGAQTISGKKTFSVQQAFTVATGTSPFTVNSTTRVANMNADLLDGAHGTEFYSLSVNNTTAITSGDDLNDYTTPGTYRTSGGHEGSSVASSLLNKPSFAGGFRMYVTSLNPDNTYISQRIISYAGRVFDRVSGSINTDYPWENKVWRELAYTDSNVASATKLADNSEHKAWGRTFWINGQPVAGDVSGDMTGVGSFTSSGAFNITGSSASYCQGIRIHPVGGAGTVSSIFFGCTSNSGISDGMFGITHDSNGLRIRGCANTNATSLSDYVKVAYGGNVGIGTTTPDVKLTVSGAAKVTDKLYLYKPYADRDDGAVYLVYNNDANNKGIHLVGGGFYADTFVSALGLSDNSDPAFDESAMWQALGRSGNEQINGSHLTNTLAPYALTSQIPTSLPNPYALNITVNGTLTTYNGSETRNITIDTGLDESELISYLTNKTLTLKDAQNRSIGTWTPTAAGSISIDLSVLRNLYTSRPTTGNVEFADGGLRTFKATSSMADADGRPNHDAHILHFAWDNNGGWDAQLALFTSGQGMMYRGMNKHTWSAWKTVLDSSNSGITGNTVKINGTSLNVWSQDNFTPTDYVTLAGAQTISGVKTFTTQQKFTVAQGTSPFTVNSTTRVDNLNADLLDGFTAPDFLNRYTSSKELTGAGWYRVAQISSYGGTILLSLGATFNHGIQVPHTMILSVSYYSSSIKQLSRGCKDSSGNPTVGHISNVRLVKYGTGRYYVDIYYSRSDSNTEYVSIGWLSKYTSTQITLIDWTPVESLASGETESWNEELTYLFKADSFQTSRTLWGRPFDGTADVSGDMTGVGSFTSSGTFNVTGSSSSYSQGIRIHDVGTGCSIFFGCTENTGINATMFGITRTQSTGLRFRGPATAEATTLNDYMIIGYGGNIGIGTTPSAYKLDVNGRAKVTSLTIGNIEIVADAQNGGLRIMNAGLYADTYISALGIGQEGGGSGTDLESVWASMREVVTGSSNHTIDISHFRSALSTYLSENGYATQAWVGNYYATQAWVNQQGFVKNAGVTSVSMSVPEGLKVNGGVSDTVTSTGSFALTLENGYSIPTDSSQALWDIAYNNSHTHSNKSVLDGITSTLVGQWNTAYTNNHTHSNKSVLDGITSAKVDNWDAAYSWGNHGAQGYLTETSTVITTLQGYFDSSGSAKSAVKLKTACSINGTNFDGSAAITTARWGTARNISISDADGTNTGSAVSVNGSAAVTLLLPSTIKASLSGNATTATTASKLSTVSKTAWGRTFWTSGGVPDSISGDMSNVGNISFSASGKNIGGLLYFDTANPQLKVGVSSTETFTHGSSTIIPKLFVLGDLGASGGLWAGFNELYHATPYIDFHFNYSTSDYTSRIIETSAGTLTFEANYAYYPRYEFGINDMTSMQVGSSNGSYIQIGSVRLVYDSVNNALKVEHSSGGAANLYALGGISALGVSNNMNGEVSGNLIPSLNDTYTLGNSSARWKSLYLGYSSSRTLEIRPMSYEISFNSSNSTQFTFNNDMEIGGDLYVNDHLGVGDTPDSEDALFVNGTSYMSDKLSINGTNSNSDKLYVNGTVRASSYNNSSDARLKNIISNENIDIETIARAPIVRFTWKNTDDSRVHWGTLAQYWRSTEIGDIVEDGEYLAMDYAATALAGVISVARTVMTHEEEIAALKSRLSSVEKENKAIKLENQWLKNEIEQLKAA